MPKAEDETVNPVGRPTKYREEYAKQAGELCLLGFTNDQLADFFNVNTSTIHEWRRNIPEFSHALKSGKVVADAKVARSLYNRATGMTVDEEKIANVGGEAVVMSIKKAYPPDPISIKYWLNNRQPEIWRERVENTGGNEDIADVLATIAEALPT